MLTNQAISSCLYVLLASHWCILMISLLDVVCFYDWIYPAPWNSVKAAYLFCRYYPLAIAPFHLWGSVGNHEERVCESYYHVIFAFILMLRTYAFSGRKTRILVVLSIAYLGLVGVIIWVLSKELSLAPLFFLIKRNACLAISDEPNIAVLVASTLRGKTLPAPIAYHVGMISELAAFFDCLNILVVLWYWVRGRDTFGPLGKSFLKQGLLVYVIMIALNTLAICAFLSSYLVHHGLASSSVFAYILPSALVIRFLSHLPHSLLLMLRRTASPTETTLRLEYSHMINDVLEMIAVDRCPEELSEGFTLSISTDAEAQH
ncbi:hypothetical protein EDB92DRAFT_1886771 [Lactarius akahatsu]|uniref:Uncharacterized protein n=1 Tax=Lactarius akahatsu TaxID=416441 RepID=A0AAD4LCJ3_9AGAM|nr:hypothetical protein EDB92DRAFT_1886771 [Lactarius akahatsu]